MHQNNNFIQMENTLMKKLLVLVCATATLAVATDSAFAENIKGKLAVSGKMGLLLPSDGNIDSRNNDTRAGFIVGAGIIYGLDTNIAAEFDVSHGMYDSDFGDFSVTDIALGAQYRFTLDQPQLVPYLGAGVDLLISDADQGRNVDTTVGVHASAGIDYFIMKQLALTAEARLLVAPETDINGPFGERGDFDPTSIATTFGVRYFFN